MLTMNRLRGEFVPIRLAHLLADLAQRVDRSEIQSRLAMKPSELTELLNMGDYVKPVSQKPPAPPPSAPKAPTKQISVAATPDQADMIRRLTSFDENEQDMLDLAAWFSAQKRAGKTADPALVSSGERLFRGGNKASGVPACDACHGPSGQGNSPAGWPAIAGQHATYSANQLVAYRSKQRTTDGDTQMMRTVASGLTDEEIQAVTSYLQGLHP